MTGPIGVFDSGSGGLTVLRALLERLPEQSFVYLGDHAHAPYGDRNAEEIYQFTLKNIERLFDHGCDLIVLACNSASAVALRRLQQTWINTQHKEKRVLGVHVPVIEAVTGMTWAQRTSLPEGAAKHKLIGVFATAATVQAGAFYNEVRNRAPEVQIVQQPCAGLVELIESGAPEDVMLKAVKGHVEELMDEAPSTPDAVILGCTHYPLIEDLFASALPPGIDVISQPNCVAASLTDYLERHPRFRRKAAWGAIGERRFVTTGDPAVITAGAATFFAKPPRFIALDDVENVAPLLDQV